MRNLRRRQIYLAGAVVLCGIGISLLLGRLFHVRERQLATTEFKLDSRKRIESLRIALSERTGAVESLAAFFAGSTDVEREEFRTFTAPLLRRYRDIKLMAWATKISSADRVERERAIRDRIESAFAIRGISRNADAHQKEVAKEFYPIVFAEPYEKNSRYIGVDLGTKKEYVEAIVRALSAGCQTVAVSAALFDDAGDRNGNVLFIFAPAKTKIPTSPGSSEKAISVEGVVFGVFLIDEAVKSTLSGFTPVGIDIFVDMKTSRGDVVPIFVRRSSLGEASLTISPSPDERGELLSESASTDMRLADRTYKTDACWTMECVASAAYIAAHRTNGPIFVSLTGFAITGLLAGYIWLLMGHTIRVENRVVERTRELRESEERFRGLVDNAADAFFLCDERGELIVDVNRRACDSLGYTRDELLSMRIAEIDVDFVPKDLARYLVLPDEDYPVNFEGVQRRKDGTTFPVEIRVAPLRLGGRRLLISLARDISERKAAESALRNEQRLLRDMLDLHERDRKLAAYEIHDGLAQQLTGAVYKFQSAEHLRESNCETSNKMFSEGLDLLREAMAETRRMISGLRPPALDEGGVAPAVENLICDMRRHDGPEIEFNHWPDPVRFAGPLESAVFRIVQESLTNACRHSRSYKVWVDLSLTEGMIRIVVRDHGVGFDPAKVAENHFGLQGIRERTRLLEGRVSIESSPGQGTLITVELPLIPLSERDENGDRHRK